MSAEARRHVVLVCGPPCAGKSSYIAQHSEPGDVALDLDDLARQAGSTRRHAHAPEHMAAAAHAFTARAARIGQATHVRAWVIRCAASPGERAWWAQHIAATEVVVLMPAMHVVQARAQRTRTRAARAAIARWYAEYRPAPCDTRLITE